MGTFHHGSNALSGAPDFVPTTFPGMTITDIATASDCRARILASAYELLCSSDSGDIGFEAVASGAGVAVEEVEARFPDAHVLSLAAIENATHEWALEIAEATRCVGADTAEQRLLALFGVYERWFGRDDFDASRLITVLAHAGRFRRGGAGLVSVERVRLLLATLAAEAGLRDADDFALSCHVLLKGAIVSALEGDTDAIDRAERMARSLIDHHRPLNAPLPHTVRLEPGADDAEWLVHAEFTEQAQALAVLRRERLGWAAYPNTVGYGRLGPYPTLDDALDAVIARVVPGSVSEIGVLD